MSELPEGREPTREEMWRIIVENKLIQAGFPMRHVEKRVDLKADVVWFDAFNRIMTRNGKGFLCALVGGRGVGKTQLLVEVARSVSESSQGKIETKYIKLVDLLVAIKSTWKKTEAGSEGSILNALKRPSLLVLDEIQEAKFEEWDRQLFVNLVDHRYDRKLDTLLVGNIQKERITDVLQESISSRMNECGGIIELKGKSYRE